MNKIRAFYFARPENRLGYEDNRLIRKGLTHSVDCKPKCCYRGLHGSKLVFDALGYAESSKLYLVDIWGDVDETDDKLCGTHREYIDRFDAEKLFKEFARKQALINIEKTKTNCSEDNYNLILEWLETGDERIREVARSAAQHAAYSAARSAAQYAAYSADYSAADTADYSAAQHAAYSAAYSAAHSAAYSAAYSAAHSAAYSAAYNAAYSAASSAAYSAALNKAKQMLQEMVLEATGWEIER